MASLSLTRERRDAVIVTHERMILQASGTRNPDPTSNVHSADPAPLTRPVRLQPVQRDPPEAHVRRPAEDAPPPLERQSPS